MAKLIIKFLIFYIPIISLILFVNWGINPRFSYETPEKEKYISDLVTLLQSGQSAQTLSELTDRKFKIENIKTMPRKNMYVFGSSRGMLLSKDYFSSESFFNISSSGAGIFDLIGFYQLLLDENKLPDTLVICFDPWLFKTNADYRWQEFFTKEVSEFLSKNKIDDSNAEENSTDTKELFEQSLFSKLLTNFPTPSLVLFSNYTIPHQMRQYLNAREFNENSWFFIFNESIINPANKPSYDQMLIKTDGSIKYPLKKSFILPAIIDQNVLNTKVLYKFDNFTEIQQSLKNLFISLLNRLLEHDVIPIIVLSPYHPEVFNNRNISDQVALITEIEKTIHQISESLHISIIGSYNPQEFGVTNRDFFDAMHGKTSMWEKVFDHYRLF